MAFVANADLEIVLYIDKKVIIGLDNHETRLSFYNFVSLYNIDGSTITK